MLQIPLISLFLLSVATSCLAVCTDSSGCFPPLGNIPTKLNAATISASTTCGQEGPVLSCPYGSLVAGDLSQCYNCSREDNAPEMAIDGSLDTWWQASNDESAVTLQLNFSRAFLVSEISLIWQNPRPRAMVLEFSTDYAVTWNIYQFFSTDCRSDFPLSDTMDTIQTVALGMEAVCDSSQSALNPGSRGMTSFSPAARISGGIFNTSSLALNYFLVTNLRVRVMGFIVFLLNEGYFHAVSEWRVEGSCFCNGHSDACDATLPHVCRCGHNTEGDNCQRCQPLFNNRPYLQGTTSEANACQACQCYAHSDECVYSSTRGSGICQECQHNTTGDSCDSCLPFFYRHPTLPLTDPGICPPCACNEMGTSDAGVCQVSTGNCNCKPNVMGRQCDQCRPGFFNLSSHADGCQPCGCLLEGRTSDACHSNTGQCDCKQNVEGEQCDTCKDGFYQLSTVNDQGCVPCACDLGGAASQVCDKVAGNCQCLRNITGSKCDRVEPGYFIPSPDYLLFEGENGNLDRVQVPGYEGLYTPLGYTGAGLVRVERGERLELMLSVPRLYQYTPVLRYFTLQTGRVMVEVSLMNNIERCDSTNRIQSAVLNSNSSFHFLPPICLQESPTLYLLSLIPTDAPLWVDALLLVPDLSPSPLYSQQVGECVQSFYSLNTSRSDNCQQILFSISADFYQGALPCLCDPLSTSSPLCNAFGGQCPCRAGVTSRDCSHCTPGYHSISSSGCTACSCNTTGARTLPCDVTTGQCVCRTGVTGLTCDSCISGFYNLSFSGCVSCECSEFSSGVDCSSAGVCTCLPGVTGEKCSQCSAEYFNISTTGCQSCDCSQSTSSSLQCSEQGNCSCTNWFSGDKCRSCSVGNYVSVSEDSTPLCKECKCFTWATTCSNLTMGYRLSQYITNFTSCEVAGLLDVGMIDCTMGWSIEDGVFLPLLVNEFVTFLITSPTQVYWEAPRDPFLGDRSLSYGLNIVFSVFSIDLVDEPAFIGNHPDIILRGSHIPDQLVSSFPSNVTSAPNSPFSIPLLESYWRVGDVNGPLTTYKQLIQVLANLTAIQVRARYSEASIARGSMEYFILQTLEADPAAEGFVVEDCDCPGAYRAPFCNACSQGYFRTSPDPTQACTRCECNGHTDRCDPITGLCLDCRHNTTGRQCDTCVDGFYGDATNGTPGDCQICPCPLSSQSFSRTCFLDRDGLPTCDNCTRGHIGRNCESCMDGYFGIPTLPGAKCADCSCSDNIDLSQTGNCNTTTGECVQCLNNTVGFECEICAPGFYGDALSDTCSPCMCNSTGRENNICEASTGVCTCKGHVLEDQCDRCESGYWGLHLNLTEGCISCDCCSNGSTGVTCDTNNGVCTCKQNVGGEADIKCCQCSDDAFNFTAGGCDLCGCDVGGSLGASCDQRTGVCQCQVGVEGDKCDACTFGYTGSPPRCDQCPQCFDDWLVLIGRERMRVDQLSSRVDSLLGSYQPLTVQNITAQIFQINTQLAQVSSLVQASQLNSSELDRLGAELSILSQNLTMLNETLSDIDSSLRDSVENVRYSAQFDGSITLESGVIINASNLIMQLGGVMTNITQTQETVDLAVGSIATENGKIAAAQASIDMSKMRVAIYTNTSENIARQLNSTDSTILSFRRDYEKNRAKLGGLEQDIGNIPTQQNMSRQFISEAYSHAVSTENRTALASTLAAEKEMRANLSLFSAQLLQVETDNTDNATTDANTALNASLAAFSTAQAAEDSAKQVREYQAGNLTQVRTLQTSAGETESILIDTLAIKGADPSSAQQLSDAINRVSVPEAVVESIKEDANSSRMRAIAANEIALQAHRAANNASSLLTEIMHNINFTQITQTMTTNVSIENAKNALETAAVAIGGFYQDTEELVDTSERIFQLGREVREIRDGASQKFVESVQNATVAAQQCSFGCDGATRLAGFTVLAVNSTENISNALSQKESNITAGLITLQSIVNSTKILLQNVTSVQLSELSDLMYQLEKEEMEIEALMERADWIEQEIMVTEQSISNLVELYGTCPN